MIYHEGNKGKEWFQVTILEFILIFPSGLFKYRDHPIISRQQIVLENKYSRHINYMYTNRTDTS